MTDLKALRREMAEKLAQDLDYGGTPRAIVQAAMESAILQYAQACLGEPSGKMWKIGQDMRGRDFNIGQIWTAMAAQRAKELK